MTDGLSDMFALYSAADHDELWQVLLLLPGPRSTFHGEAVQLFRRHHEDGTPEALTTAQLLCTDRRWERCTTRLIRGIEDAAILSDADLKELAGSFLWPDHLTFHVPLEWSRTGIDIDTGEIVDGGDVADVHLDPDTPVPIERTIPPPLRRWAAATLLRADPNAFDALWVRALDIHVVDGSAIVSGMLDVVDTLDHEQALRVIDLGLGWPRGAVRLIALDLLADRDPEAARTRAAADPDQKVRAGVRRPSRTSHTPPSPAGRRADGRSRGNDREDSQIELFAWEARAEDDPALQGSPARDDAPDASRRSSDAAARS
jgi:hypothetical protein